MGGENICVTRGVVSRIDLMDYTFSPIGQSGSSVLGAWSVEVLQFQVSYRVPACARDVGLILPLKLGRG